MGKAHQKSDRRGRKLRPGESPQLESGLCVIGDAERPEADDGRQAARILHSRHVRTEALERERAAFHAAHFRRSQRESIVIGAGANLHPITPKSLLMIVVVPPNRADLVPLAKSSAITMPGPEGWERWT